MFVEWLWTQPGWKKGSFTVPSTIDRRLSGTVVSARADHGLKLEDGVARLARNRLEQLVKEMEENGETRGRGQAPPLLVDHLVKISAACPDNLRASATAPWSSCTSQSPAESTNSPSTAFATTPRPLAESRPTCACPRSVPASSPSPTAHGRRA